MQDFFQIEKPGLSKWCKQCLKKTGFSIEKPGRYFKFIENVALWIDKPGFSNRKTKFITFDKQCLWKTWFIKISDSIKLIFRIEEPVFLRRKICFFSVIVHFTFHRRILKTCVLVLKTLEPGPVVRVGEAHWEPCQQNSKSTYSTIQHNIIGQSIYVQHIVDTFLCHTV